MSEMYPLFTKNIWLAWIAVVTRDLIIIGLLTTALVRQHVYMQRMETLRNVIERTNPVILQEEIQHTKDK